jgi:hypothetical protein
MPHQCTTCGRTFADGSKEMLSGCPDCGGNKFQFKPSSSRASRASEQTADDPAASDAGSRSTNRSDRPTADAGDGPTDTSPPSDSSPPDPSSSSSAETEPSRAASPQSSQSTASPTPATSQSPTDDDPDGDSDDDTDTEVDHRTDEVRPPAEDHAQASARTDMVSPDELADAASESRPAPEKVDGRVIEPESEDRPGLDELREELNSQFESIKIVSPGKYELNLMELYDRQEYIISLQEDGRYVIEVPGSWGDRDED